MKMTVLFAVTAIAVLNSTAYATDEDPASGTVGDYGRLVQLRSQNALYTEEIKNEELRKKLDELRGVTPALKDVQVPNTPAQSIHREVVGGSTLEVSGTEDAPIAIVMLSNGSRRRVVVGDSIEGLGAVSKIDLEGVHYCNRRKVCAVLPFETSAGDGEPSIPQESSAIPIAGPGIVIHANPLMSGQTADQSLSR